MSTQPLVSFITINYNQAQVTCDMLESTRNLTYPNVEIIVVDNGSAEDPTPLIEKGNYPNVKVILTHANLGFSGGNNAGIKQAKGDYFFLLNNDTIVTPTLVEDLLAPFATDASIGMVCPKIRYHDHPTILQYAGYRPLDRLTGRTWAIGLQEEDKGQHDVSGATYFAHGAAMMVRRDVIEKAGSLEDSYFLYYEELDWSARIRRAGFKIYYEAKALIYHRESMSVGKANPLKEYYHTRNRLLFMRRNVTGMTLVTFCLYYFLLALPKAALVHLVRGQTKYLKAIKDAIAWNLTHKVNQNGDIIPSVALDKPYKI